MQDRDRSRLSKTLSYFLRHAPQEAGLTLLPGGWVAIDDLISHLGKTGVPVDLDKIRTVVKSCEKQRFALDEANGLIRANQGHSTDVDLQLPVSEPPEILYHGTGEKSLESILRTGLEKRNRHHVHLSMDRSTAFKVGSRHGKPVVLVVDTSAMVRDGFAFHITQNGVWLTEGVPTQYLQPETTTEAQ